MKKQQTLSVPNASELILFQSSVNASGQQVKGLEWLSNVDVDSKSDEELISMIKLGNVDLYGKIFDRFQRRLFVYIFRLVGNRDEAEDILQAVFLKAFKNLDKFHAEKKFSPWIYRIAHNEAVNYLKRKSRRYLVSWEDVASTKDKLETSVSSENIEQEWVKQETAKEIGDAIEKLPEKYQTVLQLRYFQEYSYDDISAALGKPLNTVGTLINRAKRKLFDLIQTQDLSLN